MRFEKGEKGEILEEKKLKVLKKMQSGKEVEISRGGH